MFSAKKHIGASATATAAAGADLGGSGDAERVGAAAHDLGAVGLLQGLEGAGLDPGGLAALSLPTLPQIVGSPRYHILRCYCHCVLRPATSAPTSLKQGTESCHLTSLHLPGDDSASASQLSQL